MHLRFFRWIVTLAKNSPWLMIAVGLHVIVGAVMSIVVIRHEMKKNDAPPTELGMAVRRAEVQPVAIPDEPPPDRQRIPPQDRVMELLAHDEVVPFVPTEDEVLPEDLTLDVGDLTGTEGEADGSTGGTNIGVGKGGRRGTRVSTILSRRPGGRSVPHGGRRPLAPPVGTEESVLEGLCWLIRHQDADGSWGANTITQHCDPRAPCIPPEVAQDAIYNVGMTSLSLLAFLGQGITISTKLIITDKALGKAHESGEIVMRGVRWLIDRQRPDGSFSDSEPFAFPENETLSTMVLCEAYGLSKNRELRRPAQDAIDFLIAAQRRRPDGSRSGWGLGSYADLKERFERGEIEEAEFEQVCNTVDLSVTCWVVMALRSAQSCGFDVPEEVLQGALSCTEPSGPQAVMGDAVAAASDPLSHHAGRRAALVLLIRAFAGRDIADPELLAAAREIAEDPPKVTEDGASVDFYYWYFATLALYQFDSPDSPRQDPGEYWEPWNKALVKSLLPLQDDDQSRGACSRGGWLAQARGNQRGRALYNTAINVLTLEVYYRFENVFK